MNNKIHIQNPCGASWSQMAPSHGGRHCAMCNKVVIDFSDKSLDEIKNHLASCGDEKVCGRYQVRHTTKANGWHNFINQVEAYLLKAKHKRLSVFLVTMLLLLSGCHRRLQGAYAYYGEDEHKHKNHSKTKVAVPADSTKTKP